MHAMPILPSLSQVGNKPLTATFARFGGPPVAALSTSATSRKYFGPIAADGHDIARPMQFDTLESYLAFSPSRKAIDSSSTLTASMTGTTGLASNTKAGSIEQNL